MNARALIVDDHPIIRDALVSSLVSLSVFEEVETAKSFEELLEKLERDANYQLLILDLSLTDISGPDGMIYIRENYADIPIIDLRHYLEDELDMHHSTASFASRVRMLKGQGHADNQLIWMTDKPHIPIAEALAVLDEWLSNQRNDPEKSLAENRPSLAQDTCFNASGKVIAAGDDVWDGDWNNQPDGACSQVYPRYKTSREVAGDSIAGDVFKCQLQSVGAAMEGGVYGRVNMLAYHAQLERVFPNGVCDYSLPDAGLPISRWFTKPVVQLADQQLIKVEALSEKDELDESMQPLTLSLLLP